MPQLRGRHPRDSRLRIGWSPRNISTAPESNAGPRYIPSDQTILESIFIANSGRLVANYGIGECTVRSPRGDTNSR